MFSIKISSITNSEPTWKLEHAMDMSRFEEFVKAYRKASKLADKETNHEETQEAWSRKKKDECEKNVDEETSRLRNIAPMKQPTISTFSSKM